MSAKGLKSWEAECPACEARFGIDNPDTMFVGSTQFCADCSSILKKIKSDLGDFNLTICEID